jgi:uncharacterized membrane-anchored protein
MSSQNLWNQLAVNNLVSGKKPKIDHELTPWYIRFIQGFAGWLAAIFIMAFFGTFFSFIFKQPSGGLVVALGLVCSVAGYVLIKLKSNDFIDQLGMAFSLSGQLLFAIGLFFFMEISSTFGAFILGFYQLFLAWILPQYAHRLLSTAFGLFALLIGLNLLGYFGIGTALVAVTFTFIWLKENDWGKNYMAWEAIGFGSILTVIFSSGFLITGKYLLRDSFRINTGWLYENAELISSLLIALIFVNVALVLLKEYKIKFDSKSALLSFVAAIGLIIISFKIDGLSIGLLIVLLGFARHRLVLIVFGAFTVISFFSWYYYNLQATLLYKSIVLVLLGIAMLVAWFTLKIIYKSDSHNNTNIYKLLPLKATKWIAVCTVFLILVGINFNIKEKEKLIENGEVLLFKLAPVDPRSLMQGDYMRLRFELANTLLKEIRESHKQNNNKRIENYEGQVIIRKDEKSIVSFVALYTDQELAENHRLIPYKYRNGSIKFTTNAFYFQEGKANHFQKSEYGEFKMSDKGDIILVHMVDKDLKIL